MYRIIIAGSRTFNDYMLLERKMREIISNLDKQKEIEIVSGGANGADKLGEKFAIKYNYTLKIFNAKWDEYGKRAGIIRNKEMANYANQEEGILVTFWNGKTAGTKNMIENAYNNNLKMYNFIY